MPLLTNTKGEKSWSLTIAVSAFVLTSAVILLGSIWPKLFTIPDSGILIGYLTASLGTYGFRRFSDNYTEPKRNK